LRPLFTLISTSAKSEANILKIIYLKEKVDFVTESEKG